ncbi:MAG: VanZ family protein [Planctomycetota bacterium]
MDRRVETNRGSRDAPASTGVRPFPRRGHLLIAALAFSAFAVYGSLVPLNFRPLSWEDTLARFREIPYLKLGVASRADWVANILLFVPLGFFYTGSVCLDRRGRLGAAFVAGVVTLAGTMASVAIEFTQIWFPGRTVSINDVVAETIGAAAGSMLWLVVGQAAVDWVRAYSTAHHSKQQLDWLLEAYLLGFVIYSLLPLDLTISVGELVRKFHEGRIVVVPFEDFRWGWEELFGLCRDIAVFVPVGMLAASWMTSKNRRVRPLGKSILLGTAVAAAIEAAQIVVFSRYASITDVLLAIPGITVGAILMRRWRGQATTAEPKEDAARAVTQRQWILAGCVVAYIVFLTIVFCGPFEGFASRAELRERYEMFWCVPFAKLYHGTEFNAATQLFKKTVLFAPLGAMLGCLVLGWRLPRRFEWAALVVALLAAAGFGTFLEMLQVFLPVHYPDITDVLLYSFGAAVGMFVAVRMLRSRITPSPARPAGPRA